LPNVDAIVDHSCVGHFKESDPQLSFGVTESAKSKHKFSPGCFMLEVWLRRPP